MMQIVPEINLQEIINYGNKKKIGIILWAGSYALDKNLENICRHYAAMGIKGFKVDVINLDEPISSSLRAEIERSGKVLYEKI